MIAFKGRLAFGRYMPAKPMKYRIKVWMAADASNGFVINHVYLGKETDRVRENGLGYDVVMGLVATLSFFHSFIRLLAVQRTVPM